MAPRKPRIRFGEALRIARLARGISQEALEPAISRRYATQLESATKSATLATIERLAAALRVRPGTLLLLACVVGEDKDGRKEKLFEIEQELAALLAEYSRMGASPKRSRRR